MQSRKILFTENFHSSLAEQLRSAGYDCDEMPGITYDEVLSCIQNYVGIVVATRVRVDKKLIDVATQLKFIARAGSGMENIDTGYARAKNIRCINSPEGNSNSVAEHAVGLLIASFHNIVKSAAETTLHQWKTEENRVHELEGKTIAIIGYGNTGRAFAKKLQPFGMSVLAYDKYLLNYGDAYAIESNMEEIFARSHIISFHIPLTHETRFMVDRAYLQRFTQPIHLINTSRGKIIRHHDLLQLIREQKVLSASCDVYENENFVGQSEEEKNVFDELVKTGRVIFTPHVAGKSFESKKKIAEVLVKKILLRE
ncbi:MAG: NAD(P)-dependent oxidoreductase [Chitinophagales bacterium]